MSYLSFVENAVREAGKLFLDIVMDDRLIIQKGTANFVTHVDLKVQSFLTEELYGIIPGSNMITEESEQNRYSLDQPTWILDPVDGTTNLMYGYRHSAISLALFVEQKACLGVIFNPFSGEMFTAEAGKGAFLNDKAISVSGRKTLCDSLVAFGTAPYDRSESNDSFQIAERLFFKSRDIRRSGSAALDIAYVACGRIEGFFEKKLQPWDYAAGMLILEEAGGRISNWEDGSPSVLKPDSILATNGWVHGEMLEILK